MKKQEKIKIFCSEIFKMYPDVETELEYENNFQLLVAIIMSAQTTDKQVNKVNSVFYKYLKTPLDWVKMWEDKIREYIKAVNFFNNKAKNIFKTCEILSKKEIPKTISELTKLPWVWIKTAKVYLAVVYNKPFLAVDTHVHRVLNRVWIVKTSSPLETDKKAEKIFSTENLAQLHNSLIFFGRYHCIAQKPKCGTCPIIDICSFKEKNLN